MDKGKLAALSRDALIERAEELGVRRARYLTRPELVDEILLAEGRLEGDKRGLSRGFVGLARDLLARLVERGLHLPDAAERLRGGQPPQRPRMQTSSIPTVTLAEIYAAQGHTVRAVETLERLLTEEPEHAEARSMLERLREQLPPSRAAASAPSAEAQTTAESEIEAAPGDASEPAAASKPEAAVDESALMEAVTVEISAVQVDEEPASEPEASEQLEAGEEPLETSEEPEAGEEPLEPEAPKEPEHMLDDGLLPPRYDVDECVALPVDPSTVFVYWELREQTLARIKDRVGHGGVVALRAAVLEPSWDGPLYSRLECELGKNLGEYFVRDLPEGAVVRIAIGYRAPSGEFYALAHSELFEEESQQRAALAEASKEPGAPQLYAWGPDGAVAIERSGREAAFLAEALAASQSSALQPLALKFGALALGSWRASFTGSSELSRR